MSFQASQLHVVTPVFNPLRWESRITLARAFIGHMLESGVQVTVVETALGDREFDLDDIKGINHVPTRCKTMAWSKESAINHGIRCLPHDAEYVGTFDSDIVFRNPDWATETIHQLQVMPVVQPWSEALDLGPKGEIMTVKGRSVQTSFGWVYRNGGRVLDWWKDEQSYPYPHSGYAWAWRMDFLSDIGLLLDFSGLGAADHQMALALVGHVDAAIHGLSTPAYKAAVKAWGDRAFRVGQGHLGYVPGRIEHGFHGAKAKRKYVERWDILNKHAFDPHTDLHRNRHGILELSNNKPELRRDIEAYFSQRMEDANVLQDG